MGDHLFHCGSKTIQCSNCSKYIHRANYAFHVDNQCIDFDEDDIQTERIPCELCNEQIKFSSYASHLVYYSVNSHLLLTDFSIL
jgi:hypothetical protein